jgi:uncharacterized protein
LKAEPCAVEHHIHDVLNVFMCTGFTKDTQQYFMKASPVRPGDFIEFFAETNLLGALSACPDGDCSATHSSDVAACYPLKIEIFEPDRTTLGNWAWPSPSEYHRRRPRSPDKLRNPKGIDRAGFISVASRRPGDGITYDLDRLE